MPTRRQLIGAGAALAVAGCSSDGTDGTDGTDGIDGSDGGAGPSLSSPAFVPGTPLPARFTCDGEDVSPPLRLRGTPDTESLAVVVDDPDAPTESPFVHWLLWNVPPDTDEIPAAVPGEPTVPALDGTARATNDFGDLGYGGPCPPTGDGPHTYQFTVQLLDTTLELDPGADAGTYRTTVEPHVRGETTITATYGRS